MGAVVIRTQLNGDELCVYQFERGMMTSYHHYKSRRRYNFCYLNKFLAVFLIIV